MQMSIPPREPHGEPALHIASYQGRLDIVERLNATDADFNILSRNYETALQLATRGCHFDILDTT